MARQYQRQKNSNLTSITAWHDFARNRFMFLFLAVLFGFGIIAYFGTGPGGGGGNSSASNRATRSQDVVAVVNGEKIMRAQAENALEFARMRARVMGGGSDAQKASEEGTMLGNLVNNAMLRAAAR